MVQQELWFHSSYNRKKANQTQTWAGLESHPVRTCELRTLANPDRFCSAQTIVSSRSCIYSQSCNCQWNRHGFMAISCPYLRRPKKQWFPLCPLTTLCFGFVIETSISSAPELSLGEPDLKSIISSSCFLRLSATVWMAFVHSSLAKYRQRHSLLVALDYHLPWQRSPRNRESLMLPDELMEDAMNYVHFQAL